MLDSLKNVTIEVRLLTSKSPPNPAKVGPTLRVVIVVVVVGRTIPKCEIPTSSLLVFVPFFIQKDWSICQPKCHKKETVPTQKGNPFS